MPRRTVPLFRHIERALATIALGSKTFEIIRQKARLLADDFADDLGIRGGRIYSRDDGSYELEEAPA